MTAAKVTLVYLFFALISLHCFSEISIFIETFYYGYIFGKVHPQLFGPVELSRCTVLTKEKMKRMIIDQIQPMSWSCPIFVIVKGNVKSVKQNYYYRKWNATFASTCNHFEHTAVCTNYSSHEAMWQHGDYDRQWFSTLFKSDVG